MNIFTHCIYRYIFNILTSYMIYNTIVYYIYSMLFIYEQYVVLYDLNNM